MSAIMIITLTIINAMLVWALLSQARQYRQIIDGYQEQVDKWRALADASINALESKAYRIDENGNLWEDAALRCQEKRDGDWTTNA